ncbi:MAG: glycoside hydrolase family 3 C-terminal domain-containing protein, partial [Clostridia bacterium]|nr:glycoside hydrolase family 3 C-terminal domain-containing protein [Clostridia bacterium]
DSVDVGENTMRNVYLRPFRECVKAGAASIMSSFNTVDNIPMSCNKKYLYDILRKEFGFDGIALSDAMSVQELKAHGVAETDDDATKLALLASLDMDLGGDCFGAALPAALKKNKRLQKALDESVVRVLTMKYLCGVMDAPYRHFNDEALDKVYCKEHVELAQKAAEQCIVLLENDGVLPLPDVRIHLCGPFADNDNLLGCWQASGRKPQTIYQALIEKKADVTYSDWTNRDATLALAKQCDVSVVVIGDDHNTTGEARSRTRLDVNEKQLQLLKDLKDVGAKVVTLVYTARPLLLAPVKEVSNALLQCWDLGSGAGKAIANTLLGENVPGGKLPVTFPATLGQIPIYYNRLNTGRPHRDDFSCSLNYIDGSLEPLYPFGYGLSYSKFAFGKIGISANTVTKNNPALFSVDVKNEGEYDGYETVMLFLRDPVASVARPVNELVGFEKIFLKKGESKTVFFVVDKDMLAFYGAKNKLVTEKGKYLLWASNGVEDTPVLEIEYV